MALDFPNTPNLNQIFDTGTVKYKYDGVKWTAEGQTSSVSGPAGYVGSTGYTGSASTIPGYTGSHGIRGYDGSQGERGTFGYTGSRGDIGYVGSEGSPGQQGFRGYTGSQGAAGDPGQQGPTGDQGVSVTLVGTANAIADLPLTGNPGDGWIVTQGSQLQSQQYAVTNSGPMAYVFDGANQNISISATAGSILTFNVNASGHPFWIKTALTTGTGDAVAGVTNNGSAVATIVWDTTGVAPGTYYYICQYHSMMMGTITITAAHLPGSLWFWSTAHSQWEDIGKIVGPQGDPGYTGSKGSQGNIGLTGDPGYTGSRGANGYVGSRGSDGAVGYTGSQGLNANTANFVFTNNQMTVANDGNIAVETNGYTWTFDSNGVLTFPNSSKFDGQTLTDHSTGVNYTLKIANGGSTGSIFAIGTGDATFGIANDALNHAQNGYVPYTITAQNINLAVPGAGSWRFAADGTLTFPDQTVQTTAFTNGTSWDLTSQGNGCPIDVTLTTTTFDVQVSRNHLFFRDDGSWDIGSYVNETYITGDTSGGNGIALVTDRGTVLFGNSPEQCAPTQSSHFHIMRDDPNTVDLFFGDDYNYVKLPYTSTLTNVGVQIGTDATNLWSFGRDGALTLPNGATIVDTTSTLVLTPNSPAQKTSLVLRSTYNSFLTADYPTAQSYQQWLHTNYPESYPNDYVSTGTEGTVIAITLYDSNGAQYNQGDVNYVITGTGITAADFTPATLTGTFSAANWVPDGNGFSYTNTNMIMIANDAIVEGQETFTLTIITTGTYADYAGSNYVRVNIADGTTEGSESGHIHLISENMAQTSIFLGDDNKYVKVAADGQVYINVPNVDTSGTSQLWTFGAYGLLTLPSGNTQIGNQGGGADAIIASPESSFGMVASGSTGSLAMAWTNQSSEIAPPGFQVAGVFVNNPFASTTGTVQILTGVSTGTTVSNTWEFGADGTTTFPNNTLDAGTSTIAIKSTIISELEYINDNFQNVENEVFDAFVGVDNNGPYLVNLAVNSSGTDINLSTWSVDSKGNLVTSIIHEISTSTDVGDIVDMDGNSIIYTVASETPPTRAPAGRLWYNSVEGRMYIRYTDLWVDASPTIIPPPSTYLGGLTIEDTTISAVNNTGTVSIATGVTNQWTFDTDGNLTLPTGGSIYGLDIIGGEGTYVVADQTTNQVYIGSHNTQTYITSKWIFGQYGLSFPQGSIFGTGLDNDEFILDSAGNKTFSIYTYGGPDTYRWKYGTDGTLTLPDGSGVAGGFIYGAPGEGAGISNGGTGYQQFFVQGDGAYVQTSVNNSGTVFNTWQFGLDGKLTLPGLLQAPQRTIATSTATGVLGQICWDDNNIYVYTSTGWKKSALTSL